MRGGGAKKKGEDYMRNRNLYIKRRMRKKKSAGKKGGKA